jgi:hypothetical protein
MKKRIIWLLACTLFVSFGLTAAIAADRVFVAIATGGTGGTYYPLGGMLAQLLSNTVTIDGKKLSATAETSNASVANATLLGKGEIETAFVAADILDAGYKGIKQFDGKKMVNLRALGSLYPETVQMVVRTGANMNTFADIKGKSVSSGSPGSGQWQLLGDLLEAHGLTRADVKEDYSSFAQSVEKIKDGNLDVSLITAGAPTASITELSNAHEIKILPLAGPGIDKLQSVQPYYAKTILRANTYKGQTTDVPTIAVRAIWASHDKLDDEMAYQLTKALYENTETLAKVHVMGKEITLQTALESISIPLHPGAERFYKEKGMVK